MQIRYAASAVFDYVTKGSQPIRGIKLGTRLIYSDGMKMQNSRKFRLLVRIAADNATAISENTNDTTMLPMGLTLFIRKLNYSQQILTSLHRHHEILLPQFFSV